MEVTEETRGAVSYTHLISEADAAAAKKADLHLAKPQSAKTTENTASYFVSYIIPVSYTHLGVHCNRGCR